MFSQPTIGVQLTSPAVCGVNSTLSLFWKLVIKTYNKLKNLDYEFFYVIVLWIFLCAKHSLPHDFVLSITKQFWQFFKKKVSSLPQATLIDIKRIESFLSSSLYCRWFRFITGVINDGLLSFEIHFHRDYHYYIF